MKYIFFFALMAISSPGALWAHDGSNHVEVFWYQEISLLTILISVVLVGGLLAGGSYYFPRYQKLLAGMAVCSLLFVFVGFQMSQINQVAPVSDSVVASLTDVPVTVYRTPGCSCCSGFATELTAVGAEVTVETITSAQMQEIKNQHGVAQDQMSCHTSIIDGYVVEGHVPFTAIAQLIEERPFISGITLPGMPVGTPGMPGKQTEVYTVKTLDNEPFWQSS
jgi:hypothetical protein